MVKYLKIPKERIKLLLEEEEKLKKLIEKKTKTKIKIEKGLCEIEITETKNTDDPFATWKAHDVIKAIGRGFEPEIATQLLEDKELKVIALKEFVGKSKNALIRIKGRVIGRDGKAKESIESLTNTNISVQGRTVSIIGDSKEVQLATRAVAMLASGVKHGTAYIMLEKNIKSKQGKNHG